MLIQLWFYIAVTLIGWIIGSITTNQQKDLKPISKFIGFIILTVTTWFLSYVLYAIWPKGIPFHWQFVLWCITASSFIYFISQKTFTKDFLLSILRYETLGIIIFLTLNFIRLFKPDLSGTERPMDLSFIYNFTKQPAPPFENPWLVGAVLNYYYLGQFLISIFAKLTFLPIPTVYTFTIAYMASLIFQAYFVLFHYIAKIPEKYSKLFALTLSFGGNFYGFTLILSSIIKAIQHLTYAINWPHYYFPAATRVIRFTINEFPAYSIAIGDLHGHFIALPFFIISLYLLYLIFLQVIQIGKSKRSNCSIRTILLGTTAFFLFASNSWDALTLFELAVILGIVSFPNSIRFIIQNIKITLSSMTITILLYALFKLYFIAPINGVGLTIAADYKFWFPLWGQLLILAIIGLINYKKILKGNSDLFLVFIFAVGLLNLILVNFIYLKDIFSTLNSDYSRANTIFKIYYQLWTLLGVSSFAFAYKSIENIKKTQLQKIARLIFSFILAIMLSYWLKIIGDYFPITLQRVKQLTPIYFNSKHLNDFICQLNFFSPHYALDRRILQILQQKTQNTPPVTIAEAMTSQSYSLYGRMFIFSGNRTITGWPFHNAQWYNGTELTYYKYNPVTYHATHSRQTDDIYKRLHDIQAIYHSDLTVSKLTQLVKKYHIQYIVIGQLEYEFFGRNNINKARAIIRQVCSSILNINNTYYLFKCNQPKTE